MEMVKTMRKMSTMGLITLGQYSTNLDATTEDFNCFAPDSGDSFEPNKHGPLQGLFTTLVIYIAFYSV